MTLSVLLSSSMNVIVLQADVIFKGLLHTAVSERFCLRFIWNTFEIKKIFKKTCIIVKLKLKVL